VLGSEMKLNFNKNKKNNVIITAATLLIAATLAASPLLQQLQQADAAVQRGGACKSSDRWPCRVPVAITGDNIYVAWWTNNTANGNDEVMFRASTDGGTTFGDKINLSNSSDADSWRVEIAGEGDTVVVSWWETNQTSDTPVARISTDAGETFGPMIMLGTNGTISATEEEGGEGGETVEEEAVGGAEVAQ
jgi:hypothetical protein